MSTVINKSASTSRRNKKVALATAALLAVSGGVAVAYWTVGGSGEGTAGTGTTGDILPVQTSVVTDMHPGDSPQSLSGDFTNGDEGPVYVGTVTASIENVVKAATAVEGTCDATDYTLANAAMTVDAEVPVGFHQGTWSGATINFNDKATTNQDACQGATVNLGYTIS